jgi:hypothetical protein
MANEHTLAPVGFSVLHHKDLGYAAQWEPLGATQTFTAGNPVVWASGLLVLSTTAIETDAANKVTGIAMEDAVSAAASVTSLCKFMPAIPGVIFHANLLTGDGADYVFEAAALGHGETQALRSKSGLVTTSVTDWFLDDADANGTQVVSTVPDIPLPNVDNPRGTVGDTNIRVGFIFVSGVTTWPDA